MQGKGQKKQRFMRKLFLLLFSAILFISFSDKSIAEDKGGGIDGATATGFNYQVFYPENQINKTGFYYIRTVPNQKQALELELSNPTKEKLTVNLALNSAKTNANGVIEYGPNKIAFDKSLKYDITKLVEYPKSVTLEAGERKIIKLEVSMPDAAFDGMILGGLELKKQEDGKQEKKETGAGVINRYAYMIGVAFQQNDTVLEKNLAFNKATAGQSNYRNSVLLDLSNEQAMILEPLSIQAEITAKDSSEVLFETSKAGLRMAPNSGIEFPVSMEGRKMEAGKYKAHVIAKSDDKKWEWTKDFTITKEQADKFNREDVGLVQERGVNWKLIAMIVFGILIVLTVVFFVIHKVNTAKKKKKIEEQRRLRKNNKRK
ncbi:MAG: DUF916 and DUF3324 domain-containing protein [Lactobacillales bacterium]|jgi:hypothetical protein|nr:DUF916 and DUF3324 domain-containing protein [Lactobacillales bacterium]